MKAEQDKTLAGVQIAMQMEIDGKEYYQKASQRSSNQLGKSLLEWLAAAEDAHLRKFVEIYEAIRLKYDWPMIILPARKDKELDTIFAGATKRLGATTKALATELDTVRKAMEMENKTYDFYKGRSGAATHDTERNFYEGVAAEERGHHSYLLDYYEYLQDPAAWFVKKEHPSLDGA